MPEDIKQDSIKIEETAHLKKVLQKVVDAKNFMQESLKTMGESNLDRLRELKEVEGGADFEIFLEQLQEKNETFNIKDKISRIAELDFLTKEPYFARIDISDPQTSIKNKLYLGKFGYTEKKRLLQIGGQK
jgi:DNA helicase IV